MKDLRKQISLFQGYQDRILGLQVPKFLTFATRSAYFAIFPFIINLIGYFDKLERADEKKLLFEQVKAMYVGLELPFNFDVDFRKVERNEFHALLNTTYTRLNVAGIEDDEVFAQGVAEILSLLYTWIRHNEASMKQEGSR